MEDREPRKKRLGYRTFFNIGFLAFVFVVVITGAFSVYGLRFLNRTTDEMGAYMGGIERTLKTINERQEPLIRGLEEMRREILAAQLNLYMAIGGYKQTIREVWPHVEALHKRIAELMGAPTLERPVLESLSKIDLNISEYRRVLGRLENLRNLNQSEIDELGAQALAIGARISDLSQSIQAATQKQIELSARQSGADALASIDVAESIRQRGHRIGTINMTAVFVAVVFSLVVAILVKRAITSSISTLHEGAKRIGQGALDYRLPVETEDEIGKLAEEFNNMAGRLQEAYSSLEQKVEERTRALTQSLDELRAMSEIIRAVNSSLNLGQVLTTVAVNAAALSESDMAAIFEFDDARQEFRLTASHRMSDSLLGAVRQTGFKLGEGAIGLAGASQRPVQLADLREELDYSFRGLAEQGEVRAILALPMIREGRIVGGMIVARKTPGSFGDKEIALLSTFANQCVIAIENARLFREIEEKSRQVEVANRHKSEFLANMSHELRTPLNAILGFNEMILGQIYGEVPADLQVPLTDIQNSGKHLLRLINNVLDLSKIEAGRVELALGDYSVQDTVGRVRGSLRPLAADEGLEFVATVPADIPLAYGDGGRITQCLMNLAGNALKFTRQGRVEIGVELQGAFLVYRVADTGIGIAPDKIESVFAEFRQGDATITSEFGGTGLGLSITKKFVEMHGGRIWVESEVGKGSTFFFAIPLRLAEGKPA